MVMVGHAMARGGLKDSENAPISFFPKINRTVFCQLGADMNMKKCKEEQNGLVVKPAVIVFTSIAPTFFMTTNAFTLEQISSRLPMASNVTLDVHRCHGCSSRGSVHHAL